MQQTDILLRARTYLDQITRSIDPLTGQSLPGDSVLLESEIREALLGAWQNLGAIIVYDRNQKRPPYTPDPEMRRRVRPRQEEIGCSDMVGLLNQARDIVFSRSLVPKSLYGYLLDRGYLQKGENGEDVTEKGRSGGFRISRGPDPGVTFSPEAQALLLNSLDDLSEYCKAQPQRSHSNPKSKIPDPAAMDRSLQTVKALSQGRHPVSGQDLPPSDPAAGERLRTCFDYVARALARSRDLGFFSARGPFSLSRAEWERLAPWKQSCAISLFVSQINRCPADPTAVQPITIKDLQAILARGGFLTLVSTSPGRDHYAVTARGKDLGLEIKRMSGRDGMPYMGLSCPPAVQQYLIEKLEQFVKE